MSSHVNYFVENKSLMILDWDISNENCFRGEPTTNSVVVSAPDQGRYNNPSFSGSITTITTDTFKGSPVYLTTFIPQNNTYVSRLGGTEGFGFYFNPGIYFSASTYYVASIYFKSDYPLEKTSNEGFINTYSNVNGWGYNTTTYTRYKEGKWTRLYTQLYRNSNGYIDRAGNYTVTTHTVNTVGTTTLIVSKSIIVGDIDYNQHLFGIYSHIPTIYSNGGLTGLSILDHGTETSSWTKVSYPTTFISTSMMPYTYYVQLSVPSTGGSNVDISLRYYPYGYYYALWDAKYWKATFDTTSLSASDTIKTYWSCPMVEQKNNPYPSKFVDGIRGGTVGTGGGLIDLSGRNNHGSIIGNPIYSTEKGGCLATDGVDDYLQASAVPTGTTRTVSIWYNYNSASGGWGPLWRVVDWRERIYPEFVTLINSNNTYYYLNFTQPAIGEWVNICYSYNGTAINVYRNGVLSDTDTMDGNMNTGSYDYRFGMQAGGSSTGYTPVTIGKITFWDAELTPTQVLNNFNMFKTRFGL